jgi:hypothetical protein
MKFENDNGKKWVDESSGKKFLFHEFFMGLHEMNLLQVSS